MIAYIISITYNLFYYTVWPHVNLHKWSQWVPSSKVYSTGVCLLYFRVSISGWSIKVLSVMFLFTPLLNTFSISACSIMWEAQTCSSRWNMVSLWRCIFTSIHALQRKFASVYTHSLLCIGLICNHTAYKRYLVLSLNKLREGNNLHHLDP